MGSFEMHSETSFSEEDDHCSYALQLVTYTALPMVLNAAIKLDVFEIIAKAGPGAQLSPSQIASQMPVRNPEAPVMLDRMLRLLASYSLVSCSVVVDSRHGVGRLYGLAPAAKYFVKNQEGVSLGPLLDVTVDKVYMENWYEIESAVLEGGVPFNRAHDMSLFEYTGKDQKFNKKFNDAMSQHTTVAMNRILERYKGFENLQTLVDVGGGIGVNLGIITSKYPKLKGINFDLPHVIEHAPSYPGVEHIGGDMFGSVPKGDAIFMKSILHNWDDCHCLKLLKNCYEVLPENGKVVVVDAILPVNPDTSASTKTSAQFDQFMLAVCEACAKERSEAEFLALAKEAGFRGLRKECLACNLWVMEFYK